MDIAPEQYFYARNEAIITNLSELKESLDKMDDDTFNHHVTDDRNDFSEWIKHVVGDKKLAKEFTKAKSRNDASKIIQKKIQKTKKKETAVEAVEKEIHPKKAKKKSHTEIDVTLEKFDEIIQREKEIEKKEEKIKEVEERIEKQLKQPTDKKFFSKEFIQGVAVGVLLAVIAFLVYFKFFS